MIFADFQLPWTQEKIVLLPLVSKSANNYLQERVSPEPLNPGQVGQTDTSETRLNKSQLIASLNCELDDLRQEILRRRRGLLMLLLYNPFARPYL